MKGKELSAKYDGYTSAPIFTGDNQVLYTEFKYDKEVCESFPM